MITGKKDEKPKVKECFQEFFSDKTEIDHWESVYDLQNIDGFTVRQRMNQALSWLDGSNLSKNSIICFFSFT